MALSFDEQTKNCLQEWSAFVDRLQEAARDAESQTRYQILDMVGALRIRIASGLGYVDQLRSARGAQRETLRRETQSCIAELQRVAADKQSQWQWRLNSDACKVVRGLIDSVPVWTPSCDGGGPPVC